MKIAVMGIRGIPARSGGAEKHAEELYTRLASLGCDVTVYNRARYTMEEYSTFQGVTIRTLPTFNTRHAEAIVHTFLSMFDMILAGKPDIVHIHSSGPSFLAFLPRVKGCRVVCTCHGLDWQRDKWGPFASRCLKMGEEHAVRFADGIICVSRSLQEYFQTAYCRKTEYIPNGVTIPRLKPARFIRSEFGLEEKSYFLFTGRLVPEKGVHYLAEAFRNVATEKKLVITGGSSHTEGYEKTLREMAGDDQRIVFTGYRYGDELAELYSNAYAYVIPSDLEGLPIALLEAVSYGIPVIASDIPPNVEVVGDREECAFLFKQGDIGDLRRVLQHSVEHPAEFTGKANRALNRLLKEYNWDAAARKTLELYNRIA